MERCTRTMPGMNMGLLLYILQELPKECSSDQPSFMCVLTVRFRQVSNHILRVATFIFLDQCHNIFMSVFVTLPSSIIFTITERPFTTTPQIF
jgi:hypothetical protein